MIPVGEWAGRKVRRLIRLTLQIKGTTCHLCGQPGANSADHDPLRRDLLRAGVPDPDSIVYLWPSHKLCNLRRGTRPVTPQLRAELRRRMTTEPEPADGIRSSRFASFFDSSAPLGSSGPSLLSPGDSVKTLQFQRDRNDST